MESREIVTRAIEFRKPPRLPFFQHVVPDVPDDICDSWEMDRAKNGWFFDNAAEDDWRCRWAATEIKNMGQVIYHPLADWAKLDSYKPPNPKDPFYFERIEKDLSQTADRYVIITSHFNLIERLYMLHGFAQTLENFYSEPAKIEKVLDMILNFKLELFDELYRRFGNRVNGVFCTDDWGTQKGTFISGKMFEEFFLKRYRLLVKSVHDHKWHFILHSCGKINSFVPYFIDIGVDVLNMQQPQLYGIQELAGRFTGKVCFLTTADIQSTIPSGDPEKIRTEVRQLVLNWSTPDGGFIVFNYGFGEALGVTEQLALVMFTEFKKMMYYWNDNHTEPNH